MECNATLVGASNRRHFSAVHSNYGSSGFEIIHGLLDYLMVKMDVKNDKTTGYSIEPSNESTFFPKMQASIFYKGVNIGIMGIVHPDVLKNFGWTSPSSLIEFDVQTIIEDLFKH